MKFKVKDRNEVIERMTRTNGLETSDKEIKIVKSNKLHEEGKRLSTVEAFLTMFSVAIGIGYAQLSNFFIRSPEFYFYPIVTVFVNMLFGYFSIYMLVDAFKVKNRVGSFQEMAYFFTNDRTYIMIIGLQYAFNSIVVSSFSLSKISEYVSFLLTTFFWGDNPSQSSFCNLMINHEGQYYVLLTLFALLLYHISFRQNYQNY